MMEFIRWLIFIKIVIKKDRNDGKIFVTIERICIIMTMTVTMIMTIAISSIVIEVIGFVFFMKRFHIQKKHKKQTNDHIFMRLDA